MCSEMKIISARRRTLVGQFSKVSSVTFLLSLKHLCRKSCDNLPVWLKCLSHFRSRLTPYAKQNGGNFTFVIGKYGSLPNDQVICHLLQCYTATFVPQIVSTDT